jgi:hypothetical protein
VESLLYNKAVVVVQLVVVVVARLFDKTFVVVDMFEL